MITQIKVNFIILFLSTAGLVPCWYFSENVIGMGLTGIILISAISIWNRVKIIVRL